MQVYLVHLKTSGEVWHTAVCEDHATAVSVIANYGITRMAHGSGASAMCYESEIWTSDRDASQTATVVLRDVVRAR